jgi:hypothetical protein
MLLFISYSKLGLKEIEVLNLGKPALKEGLAQVGNPVKFTPKILSDASCKHRYKTTAIATRIDEKTITVVWEKDEPLNIKSEIFCGILTIAWENQADVFHKNPCLVTWLENEKVLIYPEFAALLN